MTRSAALRSSLVLALVLAAYLPARADGPPVPPPSCGGAPGSLSENCYPPESGRVAEPEARPERDLRDYTHVSLVPTGNTLAAREVQVSSHEFLLWRVAMGITDGLELSMTVPVIPVAYSIGARLALTERSSPLRITVGTALWLGPDDSSGSIGQGTLTVAHQTETTNLHASATVLMPLYDSGSEQYAFGYAVGVMRKFGRKSALVAEFMRLAFVDNYDYYDCNQDCSGSRVEALHGVMLGVKLLGERSDIDLGILIPVLGDDVRATVPPLPVVSVSRRW